MAPQRVKGPNMLKRKPTANSPVTHPMLVWFTGVLCSLPFAVPSLSAATKEVAVVPHPPTASRNDYYAGYREPLLSTPLVELPVGAVAPHGWLRKQLELQAAGFHGHLGEISRFLMKKDNAWLSPEGKGDHGWEEVPYWLKGYILNAYLLDDPAMIKEAHLWIEGALNGLQADGWFGPHATRATVRSTQGPIDLWPNMVMLFCLQTYYDHTQDERVLHLMEQYFRWELAVPEDQFLPPYWQQQRAADNLYSVYWLYNRTGQAWLLDLASKIYRHTANWTDDVANWHNVNMSQAFGGPTTYYVQSKDPKHLLASYRNYDKIYAMYGQVPGGMFGGDENCRVGFHGPRQAIETCGIVEMMLSQETLVAITGDLLWADRCEDAAFNTLPAAILPNFRGLRYLTAPNQVVSDRTNKSPGVQNGGPMFLMSPNMHRCCQHNFGHGWPYFAAHLWYATPDDGLAAVFYNECDVTARVGDGSSVTIHEATHYPFTEDVTLRLDTTGKDVTFPLYLRVPGWCAEARIWINDRQIAITSKPDQFVALTRAWSDGDTVRIHLPMEIGVRQWKQNRDSISVDRGPLTYSLKIGEKYVRVGGSEAWPDIEIRPTTPWNYGLVVNKQAPEKSFEVIQRPWPKNNMPFTQNGVPIQLSAKGKRIPEWQLDRLHMVGKLQPSPVWSEQPTETITLLPMGAARLRISAFPEIGDGPNAHHWKMPPQPLAYHPQASHCWPSDTVDALCDRQVPRTSSDQNLPRMTWWDHRGTSEWVAYRFDKPRRVDKIAVYWFDDTGKGNCRLPATCRALYRDSNGQWVPVKDQPAVGVAKNQFNTLGFPAVTTAMLRLEVKLQDGWSGGILEWQISPE